MNGSGMVRLVATALALLAARLSAADQYWVAYEGNDFPENAGWTRYNFGDGPAVRSIENGVFVLDSRASTQISDFYEIQRPLNPSPGEVFVAEWRTRILFNDGNEDTADAGITIAPDQAGTLSFRYFVDQIRSTREGWSFPIEPLEFHTYRIESFDMEVYSLWIDGQFIRDGAWDLNSLNQSFFNFGDGVRGARSLTEWDYVHFGVVPEPSTITTFGIVIVFLTTWRSRS